MRGVSGSSRGRAVEMVVFMGIQATGKSTFYRTRFLDTHVRLNLDMLRTRRREAALLEACLRTKTRVVIDNTNPSAADRARYLPAARAAKYRIVGYFFESRIEDALKRNATRGSRAIPVPGVHAVHGRLEMPCLEEGFDALYLVQIGERGAFKVSEWPHEL